MTESSDIVYSETRALPPDQILALYRANGWSSAEKPEQLQRSLKNSHRLVSAWEGEHLIGLGNSISDDVLVVYYPHLLVLPEYQGRGIGREIMRRLMSHYEGFHQQVTLADERAFPFFQKIGFTKAGRTQPMWIYSGEEH